MATDRTSVFEVARLRLGAARDGARSALLIAAGRRLAGAATGLIAGALLAVAFLPVHYSHLALNDAPTLAPACLALLGVAMIYRAQRLRAATRSRGSRSAWPARRSTRPGSSC